MTFPQVLAGPFFVTATFPAGNESGFAPGKVTVNSSANVTVVLQSSTRGADSPPFSVLNLSLPFTGVLSLETDSLFVSVLNGSAPSGPLMVVEADSLMFSVLNTAPVARTVPHGNTVLGPGNQSASNGAKKRRSGVIGALFVERLGSGISSGFRFLLDLHPVSARRETSSASVQGAQK